MIGEIEAAVTRMLGGSCSRDARRHSHPSGVIESAWSALIDTGFPWVGLPEASGGSGGSLADLMAAIQATGRAAAPVPLAEAALANWLKLSAGLEHSTLSSTVSLLPDSVRLMRDGGEWRVNGTFSRVPWALFVDELTTVLSIDGEPHLVLLPLAGCTVVGGLNLAGDSRDHVVADGIFVAPESVRAIRAELVDQAFARGALSRAAQIAGALQSVRDLTVSHAGTRRQFGRSLAEFQMIQGRLTQIEEGVIAVAAAVAAASRALDSADAGPSVAAAKVLAGLAADEVLAHSHQVHGAMGLTMEHDLQLFVRRIAAWRWEFGSARHWSRAIGASIASGSGADLWNAITHSLTEESTSHPGAH